LAVGTAFNSVILLYEVTVDIMLAVGK